VKYDSDWNRKILNILEEKTSINSETGCWEWQGVIHESGYGRVMIDQVQYYVHVLSGMVFHGYRSEYEYLRVLHKCATKNCWHRDHLYVGTQEANMQDKSRNITHCPQGHEYTPENTYIHYKPTGGQMRGCRECRKARTAAYNEKRRLLKFGKVG